MHELLLKVLARQKEFKELSPCVQAFLLQFFELFIAENGCKEKNKYFAERLGISVKNVEVRFHKLREAKILITELSSYFEPNANARGFLTLRTNYIEPEFKARVLNETTRIQKLLIDKRANND